MNIGDLVFYTDGAGVRHLAVVTGVHDNDEVDLYVFVTGLSKVRKGQGTLTWAPLYERRKSGTK